ncbi:MAG: ParA family protein [Alphaproteobacteria bacterium]
MTQIISAVQQKGGVGKSTFLCALGSWLAADGADVAIVDTDPQQNSDRWMTVSEKAGNDPGVTVYSCLDDINLFSVIKKLKEQHDAVLIDTAGYDSAMTVFCIQASDLVLIPVAPSALDVAGALKVWSYTIASAENARREIDTALIFNHANPRARITEEVRASLVAQDAPLLTATVPTLTAFREMMTYGGPPEGKARTAFGAVVSELQQAGRLHYYAGPQLKAVGA